MFRELTAEEKAALSFTKRLPEAEAAAEWERDLEAMRDLDIARRLALYRFSVERRKVAA